MYKLSGGCRGTASMEQRGGAAKIRRKRTKKMVHWTFVVSVASLYIKLKTKLINH